MLMERKSPKVRTILIITAAVLVPSSLLSYKIGFRVGSSFRSREELQLEEELLLAWVQFNLMDPVAEWHRAAKHEDHELHDSYLVFDTHQNQVYVEKEGKKNNVKTLGKVKGEAKLFKKYNWSLFHITPDGSKELSGIVRLKNRHDRDRYFNVCKEAFVLQATIAPERGVHFIIQTSNSLMCGDGIAQLDYNPFKEGHYDQQGPKTVNKSALVNEDEYLSGETSSVSSIRPNRKDLNHLT
jgi:hypothetical protein